MAVLYGKIFYTSEEQKELLHQLLSGLSSQQLQQLMQAYNDQGDIDEGMDTDESKI